MGGTFRHAFESPPAERSGQLLVCGSREAVSDEFERARPRGVRQASLRGLRRAAKAYNLRAVKAKGKRQTSKGKSVDALRAQSSSFLIFALCLLPFAFTHTRPYNPPERD
ncbi:MAG TPA: hypothetical protein VJ866_05450 [Pyrinomonadaceae bacterium]|nr:hypothetical protein [Pyrinomonadaceae bacterium]